MQGKSVVPKKNALRSDRGRTFQRTEWVPGRENLFSEMKKIIVPQGTMIFLAADEGFEPSQTESESGVLPLHKSAVFHRTMIIISHSVKKSIPNFKFFQNF